MYSIKENVVHEIVINKSRFITVLVKINNKDEVDNIISKYKKIYKDATHYCFAYILNGYQKCSDDGEPKSTAGMPLLKVLENNHLTNILCLVIRYFGGIKLGAGGLVRAYTKSVTTALEETEIGEIIDGYEITLKLNYNDTKQFDYILKDIEISKTFDENIIYKFQISAEKYQTIESKIKDKIIKKEPIQFV